ncbi:MAG: SURF1 family cytochrome oxidase biogenesis protein [Alteraurantiacibacter sp.]
MSARRIPIVPTVVVVAAAAVMVALGVWQLGRADEKAELIARYEAAGQQGPVSLGDDDLDGFLYRTVSYPCPDPTEWTAVAGRNSAGRTGYAQQFVCRERIDWAQDDVEVTPAIIAAVGWSPGPNRPEWSGGRAEGVLSRAGEDYRIVMAQPVAGLDQLARPDPGDLPNNHLAYAGQWFFFALTALLVYSFALRKKWREQG